MAKLTVKPNSPKLFLTLNTGRPGKTILSGSGTPADSLGTNGDFYIDLSNKLLYGPKADGAWSASISIAGPPGEQGEQGEQGIQGSPGVVAATAPLSYNSGTQTISIPKATTSVAGYLAAADFVTFNNKNRSISVNSPLSYNSGSGVIAIQVASASQAGYLTSSDWNTFNNKNRSISASTPLNYNSGTGALTIDAASGSQAGYLSAADWNTFNGKQSTISASGPLSFNYGTSTLSIHQADVEADGYLSSSDWNTFNSKQDGGLSWLKGGNAGTTPGADFIGTTDNKAVSFKSNNLERFRLTEAGTLYVSASDTEVVPFILDSIENQNADIFQIFNKYGVKYLTMTHDALVGPPGDALIIQGNPSSGALRFETPSGSISLRAYNGVSITDVATGQIGLTVKASDTSVHIQEWLDTGGSPLAYIDHDGKFYTFANVVGVDITATGVLSGDSVTANQYVDSEFFKCSSHGMAFGYNGSFSAIWTSGNYIYGNPFDDPGSLGGYIGLTTDSGRIGVYGSDVMSWDANYFGLSRNLQGTGYNITFDQLGIGYNPGSSENGIFLGAHAIYGSDMGDPANGASIYINNTDGYLRGASSSDELSWGNGELQASVDINMGGNDITNAYTIYMGGTFSGATYFSVFGAAGTGQHAASVGTAGAYTGTDVGWTLDATTTGGIGSSAYTVSDVIYILKSAGFLAM